VNRYEALRQAVEAHAGQRDKCGRAYILHPLMVARAIEHSGMVPQNRNHAVVVAFLHDVWEDTAFGESGPKHRRMDLQWVRDLRDACLAQRGSRAIEVAAEDGPPPLAIRGDDGDGPPTAFFFKQWGGPKPTSGGRELDGQTWDEFPQVGEAVA
jgi:hypothetical protein